MASGGEYKYCTAPPPSPLHSAQCTVQCTVCTVLCTVQCTVYTVKCALYTVPQSCPPGPAPAPGWPLQTAGRRDGGLPLTQGTVHCSLYTVHCTLYTVYCTLYSVHCTLYIVHCRRLSQSPTIYWLCPCLCPTTADQRRTVEKRTKEIWISHCSALSARQIYLFKEQDGQFCPEVNMCLSILQRNEGTQKKAKIVRGLWKPNR